MSFVAAQWPFADFLMSPESHNRIFAAANYPYFIPSTSPWVRNIFIPTEQTFVEFWMRMAIALAVAVIMTRIGVAWGEWMRRISQ